MADSYKRLADRYLRVTDRYTRVADRHTRLTNCYVRFPNVCQRTLHTRITDKKKGAFDCYTHVATVEL